MTLRERLADWISGGALTRARRSFVELDGIRALTISHYRLAAMEADCDYTAIVGRAKKLQSAISLIAAMETPKANATVKRMAKIAREAL